MALLLRPVGQARLGRVRHRGALVRAFTRLLRGRLQLDGEQAGDPTLLDDRRHVDGEVAHAPPRGELRHGERTTLEAGRRELLQAMRILDEPEPGEVTRRHARHRGAFGGGEAGRERQVAVADPGARQDRGRQLGRRRVHPGCGVQRERPDGSGAQREELLMASIRTGSGRARGTTSHAIRSLLRGM